MSIGENAAGSVQAAGYGPPGGGGYGPPGAPPGGYGPPGGAPPGGYGPPGAPPGGYGPPGGGGYGPPPGGGPPGFGPPPGGGFGPPPGGFGPPGAPPGMMMGGQPKFSPLAIISLVCGILSIPTCFCSCFAPGINSPLGIAGLTCGILAMTKIKQQPQMWRGTGMAIAGIVCGGIGILLVLLAAFTTLDEQIRSGL